MESPLIILPEKITLEESKLLITHCLENGFDSPIVKDGKSYPVWKSFLHHRPNLSPELREKFSEYKRLPDYWLRARVDLEWYWVESPVLPLVNKLCGQIQRYMKSLTRVQTLILKPGHDLPAHKDKVAGTVYDGEIFGLGYEAPTSFHHKNNYFSLKIPLFTEHGPGRPYFILNGEVFYYDTQGQFFAINEISHEHGALKVSYPRGVIALDGELNVDEIRKAGKPYQFN